VLYPNYERIYTITVDADSVVFNYNLQD